MKPRLPLHRHPHVPALVAGEVAAPGHRIGRAKLALLVYSGRDAGDVGHALLVLRAVMDTAEPLHVEGLGVVRMMSLCPLATDFTRLPQQFSGTESVCDPAVGAFFLWVSCPIEPKRSLLVGFPMRLLIAMLLVAAIPLNL